MKDGPDSWKSRKLTFAIIAIFLAGALLRILAARGDLWLDEIWSINLAKKASSLLGVFTEIHQDNNNYLNTIYIYFLGQKSWLYAYRIPSVVFGTLTVALAFWIGRKRSLLEGLTAMVLMAASYMMIHYSSEARGYASMLFFTLFAFLSLETFFESRHRWLAFLFSVCAALGFLSHPSFFVAFVALAAWSFWRLLPWGPRWLASLTDLAICHALPLGVFCLVYFVDLTHSQIGGGEVRMWSDVYLHTAALVFGVNAANEAGRFSGWCAILMTCVALFLMWREKSTRWIPFGAGCFLVPAFIQVMSPFQTVYERHFLIGVAFSMLCLAHLLSGLWRIAPWGRAAYGMLLAGFLALNGWQIAKLLQLGRGDYRGTLSYIVEKTQGAKVTIASDQDFRNGTIVQFYAPYLKRELSYYDQGEWRRQGAEWFLRQQQGDRIAPSHFLLDPFGHKYELVREAPYAGLSGWTWFVYHRIR
jgi:uncharacterized membrane protein